MDHSGLMTAGCMECSIVRHISKAGVLLATGLYSFT